MSPPHTWPGPSLHAEFHLMGTEGSMYHYVAIQFQ